MPVPCHALREGYRLLRGAAHRFGRPRGARAMLCTRGKPDFSIRPKIHLLEEVTLNIFFSHWTNWRRKTGCARRKRRPGKPPRRCERASASRSAFWISRRTWSTLRPDRTSQRVRQPFGARFPGVYAEQIQSLGPALFENILHPDDAALVAAHHDRFASAGDSEPLEVEYSHEARQRHWRWLRSRDVLFLRDAQGAAWRVLGSAEDVTSASRTKRAGKRWWPAAPAQCPQ